MPGSITLTGPASLRVRVTARWRVALFISYWKTVLRPAFPQKSLVPTVLRHACVILAIALGTLGASIYLIPYSLHRVVVASYDGFKAPPSANGPVDFQEGPLDFRLRRSTLTPTSIAEIRETVGPVNSDWELASRCVAVVRGRLNASDASKPKAETANAETLYRRGREHFCVCSEHAILLNEVLQALGVQSRVLWMESHVTCEYFDRDRQAWVFVDPHMNVHFTDSEGELLSTADLVYAVERNQFVLPLPISRKDKLGPPHTSETLDDLWYRNILLNGRCYALSGTTLHASSRWSHLAKFRERPSMLVLATEYNSAPTQFLERFNPRKCLFIVLAFVAGFYALRHIAGMPGFALRKWNRRTTVGQ